MFPACQAVRLCHCPLYRDAVLGPPRRSVPVGDSSTPESRTLTPLIMVRIRVPQPGSPVSGILFPRWGESPTFPRVTRADPSLWSVIFRISVRAGRVLGAGLWSPFSNFRFGMPETGSIYDGDRFVEPAYRESRATWHEVCGTNDGGSHV